MFDLFDEHWIIDGIVREEMGLNGKPSPDIFVEAAKRMGVPVHRAIVFEDANSGVEAGKKGNFGLVVGLARAGNQQELRKNGADIVLTDIGVMQNPLRELNSWYKDRLQDACKRLIYIGTPMERDPEADPELLKASGLNKLCKLLEMAMSAQEGQIMKMSKGQIHGTEIRCN